MRRRRFTSVRSEELSLISTPYRYTTIGMASYFIKGFSTFTISLYPDSLPRYLSWTHPLFTLSITCFGLAVRYTQVERLSITLFEVGIVFCFLTFYTTSARILSRFPVKERVMTDPVQHQRTPSHRRWDLLWGFIIIGSSGSSTRPDRTFRPRKNERSSTR